MLIRLSQTARCQVNTFSPQERDERVQVGHNHMRLGFHLSSISKPGNRRRPRVKPGLEDWPRVKQAPAQRSAAVKDQPCVMTIGRSVSARCAGPVRGGWTTGWQRPPLHKAEGDPSKSWWGSLAKWLASTGPGLSGVALNGSGKAWPLAPPLT